VIKLESRKTVYMLPSSHDEEHEAEEVAAFIRGLSEGGARTSVMIETPNDERYNKMLESERPGELIAKTVAPSFQPWAKSMFNALAEARNDSGALIYPIDADRSDPKIKGRITKLLDAEGYFKQLFFSSSGEERTLYAIKMLRFEGEYDAIRHEAMLENVKKILENSVDGPFLIVVGAFHAAYLEKALTGSAYDVELVKPLTEYTHAHVEAVAQASAQNPDLKVIERYIRMLDDRGKRWAAEAHPKSRERVPS
jgi:hypothetical protein